GRKHRRAVKGEGLGFRLFQLDGDVVAAALGHAVDRIWTGIVGARVDLEAVAPALAILPRARTQVAQHSLALANLELGDLAKFRGVALASAAGEIIQDAAARAVDGIGAA